MYACAPVCVPVCAPVCVHLCVHLCVCTYVWTCVCTCVCTSVCVHLCMCTRAQTQNKLDILLHCFTSSDNWDYLHNEAPEAIETSRNLPAAPDSELEMHWKGALLTTAFRSAFHGRELPGGCLATSTTLHICRLPARNTDGLLKSSYWFSFWEAQFFIKNKTITKPFSMLLISYGYQLERSNLEFVEPLGTETSPEFFFFFFSSNRLNLFSVLYRLNLYLLRRLAWLCQVILRLSVSSCTDSDA